ncbi:hypothetical protein [Roseivirga sp.]|uniref:hypothetical protein n=1 Tax=Roseivirga sp. TaxID=1964215 RepID=UPI003B8DC5D0
MTGKLILLGLNELNFEFIKKYAEEGLLPNFKHLFDTYGYLETTSENEYKLLEPWIQWTTVHTGKNYDEHQVFRLGDIVSRKDLEQLWEIAEKKGHSVGAISPFNADNRLKNPKFFVPDPWTETKASGESFVLAVSEAVSQAVNDNAEGKLSKSSVLAMLKTYMKVVPVQSYFEYLSLFTKIKSMVGVKAIVLDKLLGDLFVHQWKKHQPDFSSLFLNSGAHLQHHYLFNSKAYEGDLKNPNWYCPQDQDPVYTILKEYDKVLGKLLAFGQRIIISTGLHQKPHKHLTYYWRIKEHKAFMLKMGVSDFTNIFPRMSRDFLVEFDNEASAKYAEDKLNSFMAEKDAIKIFQVDNRGNSLFVELVYPNDIPEGFNIVGDTTIENFNQYLAFVAIKNGEHHGIGYFIDTAPQSKLPERFPLTQVYDEIVSSF